MSIRTTVTLDQDVFENVKLLACQQGIPFKKALNEVIRRGLCAEEKSAAPRPRFKVKPLSTGPYIPPDMHCTEEIFRYLEGEDYR